MWGIYLKYFIKSLFLSFSEQTCKTCTTFTPICIDEDIEARKCPRKEVGQLGLEYRQPGPHGTLATSNGGVTIWGIDQVPGIV